ncbi:DUF86 domain-containing protein [Roseofilum reptotaenium CS-1145]|uniref:DUF86 domain-containing protein n=1 Tax=Roseofilum reptotaenium AO1-A TaxID=1925591 RepID=A0A1L9QN55_9CYAN|nr:MULTISPECIES: DUF86 domain-containing protein [Roseofilum]MBP0030098.1 DUF86 domain-containing protein [Roseofilum sp. Guam]MDB9515721.1 DUF86 domain-containing protein [Roseofilum reptotaenium CS-1145]OJJ24066.1 hypothetical protein BI308_18480 [Roseofilum reptotaenium AO1-A]
MADRDRETLFDIQRAAAKINQFKQGFNRQSFLADDRTQSAIVFQLLIIGEATKRLSISLRQKYPQIPWSLMAGMRDNLIHEYDNIDIEEVWRTAESDIPNLLIALQPIIDEF